MIRFVLTILLIGIAPPAWADDTKTSFLITSEGRQEAELFSFRIGGYATTLLTHMTTEDFSEYLWSASPNKEKALTADLNRVRLSPELNVSENFHARMDLDAEAIYSTYQNSPEFQAFLGTGDENDLMDLDSNKEMSHGYYRLKVHRAYFKWIVQSLTITAGRQQIRFGSARLWDPLDLLNPVSPLSVEGAEEQKGTDAIRLEYYLTPTAEIDLIIDGKRVKNRMDTESDSIKKSILSRIKWTIDETDIAGIYGQVAKRTLYGVDLSSVVFDGLWNTSVVYSEPQSGGSFFQASAGYEYNFKYIFILLEYFYNQESLNSTEELKAAYTSSLLSGITEEVYEIVANRLITYNSNYAAIASAFDITALLRADLFMIYDVDGKALFVTPSLKYNAMTNTDVTFGIMSAQELKKRDKSSEFDFLINSPLFFLSIKLYF